MQYFEYPYQTMVNCRRKHRKPCPLEPLSVLCTPQPVLLFHDKGVTTVSPAKSKSVWMTCLEMPNKSHNGTIKDCLPSSKLLLLDKTIDCYLPAYLSRKDSESLSIFTAPVYTSSTKQQDYTAAVLDFLRNDVGLLSMEKGKILNYPVHPNLHECHPIIQVIKFRLLGYLYICVQCCFFMAYTKQSQCHSGKACARVSAGSVFRLMTCQ